jgi:hypothetical protein
MWPIVKQMAGLVKAFQVDDAVVAGIVVEMRRGQHDTGLA